MGMKSVLKIGLLSTSLMALLVACEEADPIQSGPRYSLDGQYVGNGSTTTTQSLNVPVLLPNVTTRDWPQHLSGANHLVPNAQLSTTPQLIASVDLGVKVRKPVYGASAPIIVGDVIYHYDAAGNLQAVNRSGGKLWTSYLVPVGETSGDGFGGGLAYSNGTIYAATGYGEIVAVEARSGGVLWRYKQSTPFRKPPLVVNNRVIATSKGTQSVALNAQTGAQVWRGYSAQATVPSRINGGVPASSGANSIISFASSELQYVNTSNGQTIWNVPSFTDFFSGAKSPIGDISGDPVILGNQIIAGTLSGIGSVSVASGQKLWASNIGTKGPMIVAGNSVFGITPEEQLFRLSAQNGQTIWTKPLPSKTGNFGPLSRDVSYFDPRLVNNEIWVTNSRRELRRYHAQSGALLGQSEIPKLASAPVFGSGVMVAISDRGSLLIFR